MADLLFVLFGFSCFTFDELRQFYLFGQIQTSQTGGKLHSDASSNSECSMPRVMARYLVRKFVYVLFTSIRYLKVYHTCAHKFSFKVN